MPETTAKEISERNADSRFINTIPKHFQVLMNVTFQGLRSLIVIHMRLMMPISFTQAEYMLHRLQLNQMHDLCSSCFLCHLHLAHHSIFSGLLHLGAELLSLYSKSGCYFCLLHFLYNEKKSVTTLNAINTFFEC
jgi:hypothetical protein